MFFNDYFMNLQWRIIHLKRLASFCFLFVLMGNNVRAQQEEATISLSGKWKFGLDMNDEGIHKKWYLGNLKDQYLGNISFKPLGDMADQFVPTLRDEIDLPGTTDIAGWGLPDQSPWINYLQRKHKYIGAAWYQKIIEIPQDWDGYRTELYLERVKWESRAWIDGIAVEQPDDGLVTAHKHDLGFLKPGRHLLAIRIDNRMIHPIGDKGHNYSEQTESIWNGMVGKIELRKKALIGFNRIRLFPDLLHKKVTVEINLSNVRQINSDASIAIQIKDFKGNIAGQATIVRRIAGDQVLNFKLDVPVTTAKAWSEYDQPLYTCESSISAAGQKESSGMITFSFRNISTNRYKIVLNGQPVFIRGNQEALGYPPTGYPPMDVDTWKKIFRIYKAHGLNQVRFHSSCPPDAAFQAADELGIYIMVELVWITSINGKSDLRPISATMGRPQGVGNNDRTLDSFIVKETRRLLDQFGNHPSFCFFAFGNEMDNINKEKVNSWIEAFKKDDPRHLYAATTARAVLPADDFQDSHVVAGHGSVVNKSGNPSTWTSYDSAYVYTKVPVIAHELGQFPVYPTWKEIDKYVQTPFRSTALEKSLQLARQNHIDQQDVAFRKASGYMQQLLYKDEIERQFRSRYSAGFNLLEMNDYTGQGEALVGWLDAFYDTKGIVTPEYFRNFCNSVVVLARFPKRIYSNKESVKVAFQLACNDQLPIKTALKWLLVDEDNQIVAKGKLGSQTCSPGTLVDFGSAEIHFPPSRLSKKYTLRAFTDDSLFKNEWNLWAFAEDIPVNSGGITICENIEDAMAAAGQGKKVLFVANNAGEPFNKNFSSFVPVFWSTMFFPGSSPQTLGALIQDKHPALASFPTGNALDWQWQNLCNQSKGTVLDGEAIDIQPIVQPIDDFHSNRKLATLFEIQYGKGSMVICGYNLLQKRVEAARLEQSILDYMQSDAFRPKVAVSSVWLRKKYARQGANDTSGVLSRKNDVQLDLPAGVSFVKINPLKFELKTLNTTIGLVSLKVIGTSKNPTGFTISIDGRKNNFTVGDEARTIELPYFREDFDDQTLLIELTPSSNQILKILNIKMKMEK